MQAVTRVLTMLVGTRTLTGKTALMEAAGRGEEAIARLLCTHGAAHEIRDASGRTVKDHAREQGHEGVVKLLGSVP